MDFRTQTAPAGGIAKLSADALVVVLPVEADLQTLEEPLKALIDDAVDAGDLQLKPGRTLYVHRPAGLKVRRLVLATATNASPKALRSAIAAAAGLLKNGSAKQVAVLLAGADGLLGEHAEAVVGAFTDVAYVYRHTKPSAQPAWEPQRVSLLCARTEAKSLEQALARGAAIAEGVRLARECANRPGNHCTPTFLGEQAKELGREHGFKVEVLDRRAVEKLGMGAFLAVAQGTEEPLRFIVMKYDGAGRGAAPVVLVGKGITFDTGGISIKPSAEMDEMKYDMGGAASVLGTFAAIGRLKPKVNVIGVIPACENMPDGRAVKPGDVVTSMSGQTIEILNTDAEGRLILCDALTYVERFKPAAVIDIATLTGACVIALGHHRSGLFTADDELAQALELSGQAALDPCWRMPLDEEYEEALKSNFADMGNVGGRAGGSITAAMFLRKFTGKYRWAHLDIAGTAWKSGAAKGATGRPVPLLTHFLLGQAR